MKAGLSFSVFLASACAFVVPRGLPEGNYIARYDTRGNTVVESVAPARTLARYPLQKRQSGESSTVFCGCGRDLNRGESDAATDDLKAQLGGGLQIEAGLAAFAIKGDVVAFACNAGSGPVTFTAQAFNSAAQRVTQSCGLYISGTLNTQAQGENGAINGLVDIGYMQYSEGLDFCSQAEASFDHTCPK